MTSKTTPWMFSCVALIAAPLMAATCEGLGSLKLAETTITEAEIVAAGSFIPPGPAPSADALASLKALPQFCRVQGFIAPTSDSHIEFEVWLPVAGWNGNVLGVGNGGFAGTLNYVVTPANNVPGMAQALQSGFATSSTDTGHKANGIDAKWALGHPEKIVDYGYRAIHETAVRTKAIVRAFYGQDPKHSYFSSCSNGGRQALMEAQRFPEDYDGIIAGAPAVPMTHVFLAFAMDMQQTEANPAGYINETKLPALDAAVVAACDALDGLKDGVIDDPRKCHFDPGALLCRGEDSDTCLTQPQVDALKKIYEGTRTSKGEQLYPGFLPGGEAGAGGWRAWFTGAGPGKSAQYQFATQGGAYILFQNPEWDYRTLNLDRDSKIADDTAGLRINANDPNLKAFRNRGGKLILFHGWSDAALAPTGTIDYYQRVASTMGHKEADSFSRLYMVPGMQHCSAGPGPNSFREQILSALDGWVAKGTVPDKIIATRYKTDGNVASGVARTRPLCPYPQVAHYNGSGSIDDAANFACRAPKP